MAGEPALDKILGALVSSLDAALAATVEADRPEGDAYGNAELANGAVNIIHTGTTFQDQPLGQYMNATRHAAAFDLDLIVQKKAESPIPVRLRILEADVVAALHADRTLGGLAQDLVILSAGGGEDQHSDEGARPLSIEIIFFTPRGDHRTVIGTTGIVP